MMSFSLDTNQQSHLLIILNDINRLIFDANAVQTAGTSSGPLKLKGGQLGRAASRKLGVADINMVGSASLPDEITGFDQMNRQNLANFVLNTNQYFKGFFKYASVLIGSDQNLAKGKSILFWLSRFYNKGLFENLNFEQIFDVPPIDPLATTSSDVLSSSSLMPSKKDHILAKSKQQQSSIILNGGQGQPSTSGSNVLSASSNNPTQHQQHPNGGSQQDLGSLKTEHHDHTIQTHNQQQQLELMNRATVHLTEVISNLGSQQTPHGQQQIYLAHMNADQPPTGVSPSPNLPSPHHLHPSTSSAELELFAAQQQQQLLYATFSQILKDLTFLILLIIYLFYKLRHVFPKLIGRFDCSWKFFTDFERELDPSFLQDNFVEFLQLEFRAQRGANSRREEELAAEVRFLEKMEKIMEKEMEAEISRLVQLQARQQAKQQQLQQQQLVPSSAINFSPAPGQGSITVGTPIRTTIAPGGTISILDLKSLKLSSAIATTSANNSNISTMVPIISSVQHSGPSTSGVSQQPSQQSSSNVNNRECPECGKSFRNAYKLNRHLFVHKDNSEKPFVCDWPNCTYRSISRNDLNRHRMIHTGEKPWHCDWEGCEKRYSRPDKLRHHKQTVHCKGVVVKKENNSHMCVSPGCGFSCSTKVELNKHLHSVHPTDKKIGVIGSTTSASAMPTVTLQAVQQLAQHQQNQQQHQQQIVQQQQQHLTNPSGGVPSTLDLTSVIASTVQQQLPSTSATITHHQLQQQQQQLQQSQQQQHLQQQQQLQQQLQQHGQATISVPLSMLTNHNNQLTIAHHGSSGGGGAIHSTSQQIDISQLSDSSRLASIAAVVQQQQQQQQLSRSGSMSSSEHHHSGQQQLVVVPSQLHNQISSAVPISAVVSSAGISVQQQQQNNQTGGQQQQQQRLNSISVWSSS